MPVYSSTTKNWFHTHPLLTRSSEEGPCSCLLPAEVELLVLEASHQPILQQLRRASAANSVHDPAVSEGLILTKKRGREKNKEINSASLHVVQEMHEKRCFSVVVYTKKQTQKNKHLGRLQRSPNF